MYYALVINYSFILLLLHNNVLHHTCSKCLLGR